MSKRVEKYRITYKIYNQAYQEPAEEVTVVIEGDPWRYIDRIKSDLAMTEGYKQIGTYVIEPINHLKVIK